jgi:CRISPR-associated protein Csb2
MKVASWLRHQAAEQLQTEYDPAFIQAYVQGHTHEEEKALRLSYVPVPSIFGRYGDGLIRRVLIVEPPNSTVELTRILRLKMTGCVLYDLQGREACSLAPPPPDDWTFERYIPRTEVKVWRSVTPVVLHGFNTARRGIISTVKTERLLLRAFEMAGYGETIIEKLAFQSAPWFPGTKHASAMHVPAHLEGYPRVHVEVRFRRGVRGPVLAGIGRHYGIGLFARAAGE